MKAKKPKYIVWWYADSQKWMRMLKTARVSSYTVRDCPKTRRFRTFHDLPKAMKFLISNKKKHFSTNWSELDKCDFHPRSIIYRPPQKNESLNKY